MHVVVRTASAPSLSAMELAVLDHLEVAAELAPRAADAAADLVAALPLSTGYVATWSPQELAANDGAVLRALATWIAWGLPPRARRADEGPTQYAGSLQGDLLRFATWGRARHARRVGRLLRRFARDPVVRDVVVPAARSTGILASPRWSELVHRVTELDAREPRPLPGTGPSADVGDISLQIATVLTSERFDFVRPAPAGLELAPQGDPFVVLDKIEGGGVMLGGYGMDSTAQRWIWSSMLGQHWTAADKGNPDSLVNVLQHTVETVVIPAIGVVLTAVGGPAGFAAALALATWAKLAQGASISSALVNAAYQTLASQIEKTSYYQTYQTLASNQLTGPAIAKMRDEVSSRFAGAPAQQAKALQAFDLGTVMGQSKRVQDRTLVLVNSRLRTDEERRWLTECMAEGALLSDCIYANYAIKGIALLDKLTAQATREVGDQTTTLRLQLLPFAGAAPPASSSPASSASSSPAMPFSGSPFGVSSSPSSSSSSSSGGGVAVVGGLLALLASGGKFL